MSDHADRLVIREQPRDGQLVIPLAPRAVAGVPVSKLVDDLTPHIVRMAADAGGEPVGTPELLRPDELLARTTDERLIRLVGETPDRLWLVVAMRPARKRAKRQPVEPSVAARPVVPRRGLHVPSRFRRR